MKHCFDGSHDSIVDARTDEPVVTNRQSSHSIDGCEWRDKLLKVALVQCCLETGWRW